MPDATDTRSLPPCRIVVRSKKGVELYTLNDDEENSTPPEWLVQGATTIQALTPTTCFVHQATVGVHRIDLDSRAKIIFPGTQSVQMMDVSPSGAYLLTWERWYADKCPENMKVWDASTGKVLASFAQRALSRDHWPYLCWTPDEKFALLLATNEVRVYPAEEIRKEGGRYQATLRLPGITTLSLPTTTTTVTNNSSAAYYFTSFCPGTKQQPAKAGLHVYTAATKPASGQPFPALQSKSLFQAEEIKTCWNAVGDAALVTLATTVDASGQSYYGSSQLYLYTATDVIAVDGVSAPVLDVAWMPAADKVPCFCVVSGRMPAVATLHHGLTGQALFSFGSAHRNTIAWSPHGRFLCLAGFGNLAGGMGFWDRNKCKLLPHNPANTTGTLRAEAVVGYGWAPDSRSFLVSTCTPRMNVDNGMRIFNYAGIEKLNVPWDNKEYQPDQLLQATFVPAAPAVYPDRPQSPPPAAGSGDSAAAAAVPVKKPAGRYVPPSARNRASASGGGSWADDFRREKQGQSAGKVQPAVQQQKAATGRTVVGLAPAATTKSKSALRREKAKMKKQQHEQQQSQIQQVQQQAQQQEEEEQPPAQVDPEKRARKLKKTLKQIDDLKAKDASSLNDDQKKKIASEDEIRQELASLGL